MIERHLETIFDLNHFIVVAALRDEIGIGNHALFILLRTLFLHQTKSQISFTVASFSRSGFLLETARRHSHIRVVTSRMRYWLFRSVIGQIDCQFDNSFFGWSRFQLLSIENWTRAFTSPWLICQGVGQLLRGMQELISVYLRTKMTSDGSNEYRRGPWGPDIAPLGKFRRISTVIFFNSFRSIMVPSGPQNILRSFGIGSVVRRCGVGLRRYMAS